jgi:putative inorganic carbon (hco3(-)) transporter
MRYLQQQASRRWVRLGLGASMLLTATTVLGSHSRGALLAIIAMTLFLWWKGERKIRPGLAMVAAGAVILSLMPEEWWSRMETIGAYEQDASSMGRINAWWMAWNLALDRFFGGGFMVWTGPVFQTYAPNPADVHAAHSIYFQVLGEHGFVGLLLFVAVGLSTWIAARRLGSDRAAIPAAKWGADLGAMVQVSMLGYAVGGAFLSLAYFDLPYDLMVAVVAAAAVVRKEAAANQPHAARVAALAGSSSRHTLA